MIILVFGILLALVVIYSVPIIAAHNDFYQGKNALSGCYDASTVAAIAATTLLALLGWKGLIRLAVFMAFDQAGEPQAIAFVTLLLFFCLTRTLAGKLYNRQWAKAQEEKARRKRELNTRVDYKRYCAEAFLEQQAEAQAKRLAKRQGSPCANAR